MGAHLHTSAENPQKSIAMVINLWREIDSRGNHVNGWLINMKIGVTNYGHYWVAFLDSFSAGRFMGQKRIKRQFPRLTPRHGNPLSTHWSFIILPGAHSPIATIKLAFSRSNPHFNRANQGPIWGCGAINPFMSFFMGSSPRQGRKRFALLHENLKT